MATAADIMTRDVVTAPPEMPIREVAELLAGKLFGSIPIVEADGRLVGIVTEEDMVSRAADIHLPRHLEFLGGIIYLEAPRRFAEEAEKILAMTAREIMDTDLVTIPPDTPVDEVATRMLQENLRRVLVVDDHACLIGIITRADIVRMLVVGEQLPDEPDTA